MYLDASAFREKYSKPTFISRYIFPGNHSYFTCKAWARNLEAHRDEIIRRWGEWLYRSFRLYLWGSAYAFFSHGLEAFRVVLERPLLPEG